MPRFKDEWVIDRVLFDYVAGGACACCGFQHFLPNGTADLINAISDLDTDQQRTETAALSNHPWPPELRDQVWADRVRLRQKLKMDKPQYQGLWKDDDNNKAQLFQDWCARPETFQNFRRWFQLSRAEVMEVVHKKYNIHSAFGVVLCAVVEQVAGFNHTGYPPDGRGGTETNFERLLTYDRRGGFVIPLLDAKDNDALIQDNWDVFLAEMKELGSPGKSLLRRRGSANGGTSSGGENNNDNTQQPEDDPDGPDGEEQSKTSFASDRRIIRLIIARIWTELLQNKFDEYLKENGTTANDIDQPE